MLSGRLLIILAVTLYLGAAGCSSSKNLTSANAKPKVQEFIDARDEGFFLINYSRVAALVGRETFTNLKEGQLRDGTPESVLRRLLDSGLAIQSAKTLSYTDLTGSYDESSELGLHSVTLSMQQGSLAISGSFRWVHYKNQNGSYAWCSGSISGQINKDGTANLFFKNTGQDYCNASINNGPLNIAKSESSLTLSSKGGQVGGFGPQRTFSLRGKAGSGEIKISIYTYAFAPQFQEAIAKPASLVKSGQIRVDSVNDLMLGISETLAEGHFNWHVEPNEVGRTLLGTAEKSGVGKVAFRKQPDGNWVCVDISLR